MILLIKSYECIYTPKGRFSGIIPCHEEWILDWNDPLGYRVQ